MIQLNIHIDGRLVKPFKSKAFRRIVFGTAVIAPCLALAATTTTPHTFQAGTTISANEMNENFAAVTAGINAGDTRITALEAKAIPSANAVFAYAGTSVGDGPLTRSFSSTGMAPTVTGTGGNYQVSFPGIDCGAAAPGTGLAIAQSAGASGISCRVNGDWNNVGNACRVFVGCFTTTGNLTATPFSLLYVR